MLRKSNKLSRVKKNIKTPNRVKHSMTEPYFKKENFELYKGDCMLVLEELKKKGTAANLIFADPPYFLSNGGITCKAGKIVSVNKAAWDESKGVCKDFEFNLKWLSACKEILDDNGSIWISGTMHNIYKVGFALENLGFHILNEISWFKPNAPPNLSCKYFTHSHETLLWAKKGKEARHVFNYGVMKDWKKGNGVINDSGKQMRSIWHIPLTPQSEKLSGKHPTQKPIELLKRIISANSNEGDLILDPFNGSGTTGIVARSLERKYIGIDTEKEYLEITKRRLKGEMKNPKLTEFYKKHPVNQLKFAA